MSVPTRQHQAVKRQHEVGAAAVEFALVALLLITMFFMVMEGAWLALNQASISTAARDGARYAAINEGYTSSEVSAVVAARYGELGGTVASTVTVEGPGPDGECRVSVTSTATPSSLTGFFGTFPVTGRGVMRCGG
jgi:Flp pilus assembly protein TadG